MLPVKNNPYSSQDQELQIFNIYYMWINSRLTCYLLLTLILQGNSATDNAQECLLGQRDQINVSFFNTPVGYGTFIQDFSSKLKN